MGELPTEADRGRLQMQARIAQLFERYQAGDRAAADEFISILHPLLLRHYRAQTGNPSLADDLAQECWIRVHRGRGSYRPGEPVLPWLFAIARHTRIDQYRKTSSAAKRETELEESTAARNATTDPWQAVENSLAASTVMSRLAQLSEGQREVFVMLKVDGMTVEEVAAAIGQTPGAVKQKAYRAYEALRKVFLRAKEPG
jgi:RNA polymerase sigma-70 factor, ECF subfamily